MSDRIRPGEPLTDEVVRIAGKQYGKAIRILRDEPKGRYEAIHDARKRFKRLRGLYRLVREAAPEFCARENARLRDTARTLSAVRDATALVEALDRLLGDCETDECRDALTSVRERLAGRRDAIAAGQTDLDARMAAAIEACEAGITSLRDLKLPGGGKTAVGVLARGASKTYGRAVKALARARETDAPADWHELRKHVKYHWTHLQLLRPAWPGVMDARADVADQVAEALGDDHDLAVLSALIAAELDLAGVAGEIDILRGMMAARSERLHAQTRAMLTHLLQDDPAIIRSRVAALLRAAAAD